MKRLTQLVLLLIAIVFLGFIAWDGAKQVTAPKRVVKPTIHLVAIGDSLTYGQGDEKHNGGYVGLIKPRLEHQYHNQVKTVNYGVSGDRSDQILRRINQQATIRHHLKRADVITMTVGGNDLMQSLEKIIFINSATKANKKTNQAGVVYRHKLVRLLTAIRHQNHHAPIFVISIYDPVYTYFPTAKIINQSMTKWDHITQTTLSGFHPAYFVDINHLMSYGQYNTKAKRKHLVKMAKKGNQSVASQKQVTKILAHGSRNLNQYISPQDNFHPNHKGYQQITKKLDKQMQQHDNFEFEKQ